MRPVTIMWTGIMFAHLHICVQQGKGCSKWAVLHQNCSTSRGACVNSCSRTGCVDLQCLFCKGGFLWCKKAQTPLPGGYEGTVSLAGQHPVMLGLAQP
eukprot:scaffold28377_cov18-Tisochrysis_lutea.AAC.6